MIKFTYKIQKRSKRMNNLKKITSFFLTVILAMAIFTACSKGGSEPFDADKAFDRILNEVKYAQRLSDISANAEYMFGDLPEGVAIKLFTAGDNCTDCAMMFKAKDQADVAAIQTSVNEYIDSMIKECKFYNPDEVPKLEKAVVFVKDLAVIAVVTDDVDTVNNILK